MHKNIINCSKSVSLRLVEKTEQHYEILYKLLKGKRNAISHRKMPTYEDHKNFVLNHPYRSWMIIYNENKVTGSIYIHHDNSIGLNLQTNLTTSDIEAILNEVTSEYAPLEEKKSVIPNYFFLNVSPDEKGLIKSLNEIGYSIKQVSLRK